MFNFNEQEGKVIVSGKFTVSKEELNMDARHDDNIGEFKKTLTIDDVSHPKILKVRQREADQIARLKATESTHNKIQAHIDDLIGSNDLIDGKEHKTRELNTNHKTGRVSFIREYV